MEDLPRQIWRGTFLPYAAGACHRSGPVDRLRNHEQVATAHRNQCCRAPTDIVLDRNEVEIRSCAHERLILPSWWDATAHIGYGNNSQPCRNCSSLKVRSL